MCVKWQPFGCSLCTSYYNKLYYSIARVLGSEQADVLLRRGVCHRAGPLASRWRATAACVASLNLI